MSRESGFEDFDFDGSYIYASYFLTGESRAYSAKKGKFGRVKPKSKKHGAWELALRYSTLDLDDGSIQGGEEDNITIGVNWYATKYVRFMANYVMTDSDPTSYRHNDGSGNRVDDELNVFQLRAQIDF